MKIKLSAVGTALLAVPTESFLTTRIPSYSTKQHHVISIATTRFHADRRPQTQTQTQATRRQWKSPLFLSRNNNQQQKQYDLSKPVFDLYAGRKVRGDALAKYNTLNQSEPLRINLAAFGAFFFLALPALLDEVSRDGSSSISSTAALVGAAGSVLSSSSSLSLAQMLACYGSAVASAIIFWQQKSRRSRQLTRFERELQAVALSIRLPNNILADRTYANAQTIRALQQSTTTLRLIAVSGNKHQLCSALQELQVLSTRLVQSSTYVVVVPTDGSREADWGLVGNDSNSSKRRRPPPWLVKPGDPEKWRLYFSSLSSSNNSNSKEASSSSPSSLQWFVLSATGRSVGSGTSNPSWLQLMGQHIRPTVLLDPGDTNIQTSTRSKADDTVQADILKHQEQFYNALTSGNLKEMEAIFGKDEDSNDHHQETDAVTNVINDGGRLDAWKTCLEDGARPAGLVYGNADVTILNNDENEDDVDFVYSTCVEFPAMEDMMTANNNNNNMAATPTLLAVQKWSRRPSSSKSSSSCKLVQHQTIPWTDDRPALGTLICDCRGCVSLVRGGGGG